MPMRCRPVGNGGGAGVLGLADADEADRADHGRGRARLAPLHGTIRKHGQQRQTVRLRNAWVDVDPRSWKTRDDMTINVGLGAGGKAQQFAQTMAIANVQKEMLAGGKANLVGDAQLYHTAAELTRIMAQEPRESSTIPARSIRRPGNCCIRRRRRHRRRRTRNCWQRRRGRRPIRRWPRTRRRSSSSRRRTPRSSSQVKTQAEIELARIKAELDARMAVLDAHLKAAGAEQKMRHAEAQHDMDAAETALGMMAAAPGRDMKMQTIDKAPGRSNDR